MAAIKFKKNGKPSNIERELISKINALLADDNQAMIDALAGRTLPRSMAELNQIYSSLTAVKSSGSQQVPPIKKEKEEVIPVTSNESPVEVNAGTGNETISNLSGAEDAGVTDYKNIDWVNPLNRFVQPKQYANKNNPLGITKTETVPPVEQQQQNLPASNKVLKDIPSMEEHAAKTAQISQVKQEVISSTSQVVPVTKQPTIDLSKLGGNKKNLSPEQKAKYARDTAKALVLQYAAWRKGDLNFFKNWASVNMEKVKSMAMNGRLDMDMLLRLGSGTKVSVGQYIADKNFQVRQLFTLDKETAERIREPLEDWLIEIDFHLSPLARLGIALGGDWIKMGKTALQMHAQNKIDMEAFERYHREIMAGKTGVPQQQTQEKAEVKQEVKQQSLPEGSERGKKTVITLQQDSGSEIKNVTDFLNQK